MEQAKQDKAVLENLIVLINLATTGMMADDKDTTEKEPRNVEGEWNYQKVKS